MKPTHLTDNTTIKDIIKSNLKKLKESKGFTLEQIGEILGVYGKSTISNYLNPEHDSAPDITALYRLKEYYGIPLDILCSPNFEPSNNFEISGINISEYDKFLGIYNIYYLSTSKISMVSNHYNEEASLAYGVMAIVKDVAKKTIKDSYNVYACFSFKKETPANELKTAAEKALKSGDYVAVRNLFAQNTRFYEGDFELIQKARHYSISMTGYSKIPKQDKKFVNDKLLIMGFNPDTTESTNYIGGIALSSSLSRGSEKTPCSQIVMITRPTLEGEEQDIRKELIEFRKENSISQATDSIMSRYHELEKSNYCSDDKNILLRYHIDFQFRQELEKTRFQLFYLLKEKDNSIYKFLKQYS